MEESSSIGLLPSSHPVISPFESKLILNLPRYFVYAYACSTGTVLPVAGCVTSVGYGPEGFSTEGRVEPVWEIELYLKSNYA